MPTSFNSVLKKVATKASKTVAQTKVPDKKGQSQSHSGHAYTSHADMGSAESEAKQMNELRNNRGAQKRQASEYREKSLKEVGQSEIDGSQNPKAEPKLEFFSEADRDEVGGSMLPPSYWAERVVQALAYYQSNSKDTYDNVIEMAKKSGLTKSQEDRVKALLVKWMVPVPVDYPDDTQPYQPGKSDLAFEFQQKQVAAQHSPKDGHPLLYNKDGSPKWKNGDAVWQRGDHVGIPVDKPKAKSQETPKNASTAFPFTAAAAKTQANRELKETCKKFLAAYAQYKADKPAIDVRFVKSQLDEKITTLLKNNFDRNEIALEIPTWSFPEEMKKEALSLLLPKKVALAGPRIALGNNRSKTRGQRQADATALIADHAKLDSLTKEQKLRVSALKAKFKFATPVWVEKRQAGLLQTGIDEYDVTAQAFDPQTNDPLAAPRTERINIRTNILFKKVRTISDIINVYENFWNQLQTGGNQNERVYVSKVEPASNANAASGKTDEILQREHGKQAQYQKTKECPLKPLPATPRDKAPSSGAKADAFVEKEDDDKDQKKEAAKKPTKCPKCGSKINWKSKGDKEVGTCSNSEEVGHTEDESPGCDWTTTIQQKEATKKRKGGIETTGLWKDAPTHCPKCKGALRWDHDPNGDSFGYCKKCDWVTSNAGDSVIHPKHPNIRSYYPLPQKENPHRFDRMGTKVFARLEDGRVLEATISENGQCETKTSLDYDLKKALRRADSYEEGWVNYVSKRTAFPIPQMAREQKLKNIINSIEYLRQKVAKSMPGSPERDSAERELHMWESMKNDLNSKMENHQNIAVD